MQPLCAFQRHDVIGWLKKQYEIEKRHRFGDVKFDYAIDFKGYHVSQALIAGAMRGIWQHNDMDAERSLKNPDLSSLFSVYPLLDRIVSCSAAYGEFLCAIGAQEEELGKESVVF